MNTNSNQIQQYWPFPYEPRPNQIAAFDWLSNQDAKFLLLEAPVGCHAAGTRILTKTGNLVPVEHLTANDVLIGPDGNPRHILEFHIGAEQMFEIRVSNPYSNWIDSFEVNKSHILSVIAYPHTPNQQVVHLTVGQYLNLDDTTRANLWAYKPLVVNFKSKFDLPYPSSVIGELVGYDLARNGHQVKRHIPTAYLMAEPQIRCELTTHLCMAYAHQQNQHITKSPIEIRDVPIQLAAQLEFMFRSIGFPYIKHETNAITSFTIPSVMAELHDGWELFPFTVTPTKPSRYYGFTVDGDNLYTMGNFITTHNCGKSNIGITYSHARGNRLGTHRGDSYILTPQRVLQDQYKQSFKSNPKINLAVLYGKSNYTCTIKGGVSCEIGSLITSPKCGNCPYMDARIQAKNAADTVLNYKLALTSFAYTSTFKKRGLMILDECHTLEGHLIDFDALVISEWRCKKYGIEYKQQKTIKSAIVWMKDKYISKIQAKLAEMESECEALTERHNSELTRNDLNKLREFTKLQEHVDEITLMLLRTSDYVNQNFVLTWDTASFSFKRMTGAYSFHKHVIPHADRFLFMSSTILDLKGFCADLGIPAKDAAFLSLKSEFPLNKRPVFYMPRCKMNIKWKEPENDNGRKRMIDTILELLTKVHPNDSGVIHTGNFAVAEWLVKQLTKKVKHTIYHHNPNSDVDRNTAISEFQSDLSPSILISPSSTEGLDLKEDLGRFAIFVKIGFPNLGDQWIKRRTEESSNWYTRRTLIDLIQGGGRVVRSETDWGCVYVLDESFTFLLSRTTGLIPKWWKESICAVNSPSQIDRTAIAAD